MRPAPASEEAAGLISDVTSPPLQLESIPDGFGAAFSFLVTLPSAAAINNGGASAVWGILHLPTSWTGDRGGIYLETHDSGNNLIWRFYGDTGGGFDEQVGSADMFGAHATLVTGSPWLIEIDPTTGLARVTPDAGAGTPVDASGSAWTWGAHGPCAVGGPITDADDQPADWLTWPGELTDFLST